MPPPVAAILVAVREEYAALRSRMPLATDDGAGITRGALGPCSVVLARSGMGADRAEAAARRLIEQESAPLLVIAGFCAGLAAGVTPGDVVVATRLVCDGSAETFVPSALPALTDAPRPYRVHHGPLVTAASIAGGVGGKRDLAARHPQALALDMESVGAARVAEDLGIPWVVIRAVSDGVDDPFPLDFGPHTDPETGEVRRSAVLAHVLLRPWLIPGLARLGARSARAARNLASFVEESIGAMAPDNTPRAR